MRIHHTRREFLQNTLAAGAGLSLGARVALAADASAEKPKWAITCRDAHLRQIGEADPWAAMQKIGVDGVEAEVSPDGKLPVLSTGERPCSIATEDDVKRLAERLGREKRRITAFCTHNRFDERPDEEVEEMKRLVRAAKALDVRAVRIDVVPRKLAGKPDEFLRFAIDMGKRLVKVAEGSELHYGVENHGDTSNKPEFLRKLFDGIGSPKFGLTLDTANFYWFGHPLSKLYVIYEEFAPRVFHTHCKSIRYPEDRRDAQRPMGWEYDKYTCPLYEGDIDFKRVAAILRQAGYRGDLCVENESLGRFPEGERAGILKREAELLRKLAGA